MDFIKVKNEKGLELTVTTDHPDDYEPIMGGRQDSPLWEEYLYRFAYMRSGTCRMLKFSTNVSVPFLIYAVMLSLRFFSTKLQSKQGFLFFFSGWAKIF